MSARAVGALCFVAVAMVGGCATSPVVSSRQPSPAASRLSSAQPVRGVVPWIDAPPPPYQPPATTTPPAPPANARACSRHDVSASFDGHDGAGGHLIAYVRFRNVGGSTCLLAGYPSVVAAQPGRPDVTATDGSFFPAGHAANMPPGGVTMLGLETDAYCAARPGGGGGGHTYDHISIALPGGGTVHLDVPRSTELDVTCGLHSTGFSDPHYPQPEPVYPLSVLRASLELPRTVQVGSVLRYTVALRNPTAHRVSLAPCPGFVEAADTTTPDKRTYALNCAPVGSIGAGRTVRFAMRLPVPPDSTAGPVRVLWSLQAPDTEATGTIVVIG